MCKHCGRDLAASTTLSAVQRKELADRVARYEADIERLNKYIEKCGGEIGQLKHQGTIESVLLLIGLVFCIFGIVLTNMIIIGVGLLISISWFLAYGTRRAKVSRLARERVMAAQQVEKLRYIVTRIRMDPEGALTADDLSEESVQRALEQLRSAKEVETAASTKRRLALIMIAFVACGGLCAIPLLISPRLTQLTQTKQPAIRVAWINGIDKCPTSAEYGTLVVEKVNLYRDQERRVPPLAYIPHGAQVEVLEEAVVPLGLCKVRYNGLEGYVQSIFVVDYDPLREDGPDKCYY